ncbi:hypothetical protein [uncultured Allofournierella sp.]|uniref:hypothetical protein n=1 Tax=uncultured Allofournierella sp. TaxID=1940258 RepID=UPI0037535BE7
MEPITKERLARYISLKKENENRLERLARLRSNAELPPQAGPDGSKGTSCNADRLALAVEAYLEYQARMQPLLEANRREMTAIEEAVAALPDPLEREVLRLRYLDGYGVRLNPWKDIAVVLYGDDDERSVHACIRLQGKAITNLSKYL